MSDTPRFSGPPSGSRIPSWGRRALFVLVLLAVAAGAAFGTKWFIERRAAQREEVRAATNEVMADVAALYEAMAEATQNGAEAAAALRLTLQEHLTITDRTDDQLATDRQLQQSTLVEAADQLEQFGSAPRPDVPELADADALEDDFQRLEDLQSQAEELAGRFREEAARSEQWAVALRELRAVARKYVETLEQQPATHDPDRLQELWAEERAVLLEYREAARTAAGIEGLEPMARAYLDFVEKSLAFVDEVNELLEEEEIDRYNERVEEVLGAEDPYGFETAVLESTEQSLDAGIIARLAETRQQAAQFFETLRAAEATVDPAPATSTPSPEPSPARGGGAITP